MNVQQYLNRINFKGDLTPDLATLKSLQNNHLLAVPFENLDIHYGTPIKLDLKAFYQKIVVNKRGGFCHELNGLFYELVPS